MNTFCFGRVALIVGTAVLVSACSGSSVPMGGPSSVASGAQAATGAKTFYFNGREQAFEVPNRVRQIIFVARGAAGGGGHFSRGGRVHGVITVRPGDILYVFVGGQGSGTTGGFNGGGSGGYGSYCRNCAGFGGGGASDVRKGGDHLADRILVAGGGGGEGGINPYGYKDAGVGGKGGGKTGGAGGSAGSASGCGGYGGDGGTQYDGGSGGAGGSCFIGSGNSGQSGSLASGGQGGQGGYAAAAGGGGGGGGYYGGGGGGAGSAYNSAGQGSGGGGGGGSSWASSSVADYRTWPGWKTATGNGLVVFSW